MAKKLLPLSFAFIVLFACNHSGNTNTGEEKKADIPATTKEFTPFIISEVLLYDTSNIKTAGRGALTNGEWHPTETILGYNDSYAQMSPAQMQTFIQNLIHSKDAKVYLDVDSNKLSPFEVFTFANCCDSIIEFDEKGKEKNRRFICDSASMYEGIQKIIFYETWNLNPDNGSIDKEVLGYTLCQKLTGNEGFEGKNNYRAVMHIFNDDATLQRVKKYLHITTE